MSDEHPCPCGTDHSADPRFALFARQVAGVEATVTVKLVGGRAWDVPRVWIAFHGLMAAELPGLAERFGWTTR